MNEKDAPQPEEQEKQLEQEPELPPAPTPEQLETVERLLKQASLARIRGQGSVAERLLKEAADTAPGSAALQAALGDELWQRSQFSKARACYRLAHRIEPDNVTYETKWAESIVGSAGDPLGSSMSLSESYASAKSAGCLSALLPGLGQIVMGEPRKGAAIMAVFLGAVLWAALTPNGLSGLPVLFGYGDKSGVKEFNGTVFLPMFIAIATYVAAITTINAHAKRLGPQKVDRPVPPGEGDFEMPKKG